MSGTSASSTRSAGKVRSEQVEGRNATSAADWLSSRPASWRAQVHYVVIGMCSTFRATVHRPPPHAAVVVDCFHIVQLAQRHFADPRRRLTRRQHGRRARKGDGIYTVRELLRRNKKDLIEEQRSQPPQGRVGYMYLRSADPGGLAGQGNPA